MTFCLLICFVTLIDFQREAALLEERFPVLKIHFACLGHYLTLCQ